MRRKTYIPIHTVVTNVSDSVMLLVCVAFVTVFLLSVIHNIIDAPNLNDPNTTIAKNDGRFFLIFIFISED
jgi:hypothetical protein